MSYFQVVVRVGGQILRSDRLSSRMQGEWTAFQMAEQHGLAELWEVLRTAPSRLLLRYRRIGGARWSVRGTADPRSPSRIDAAPGIIGLIRLIWIRPEVSNDAASSSVA